MTFRNAIYISFERRAETTGATVLAVSITMARVIAVANQKGGVGKTTTSINLAACLGVLGEKVLLIDIDPQGNSTSGVGIDKMMIKKTIYNVLVNEEPIEENIIETEYENLYILPSNIQLAGAEVELVPAISREHKLKNAIEGIRDKYDFIIIDCPPSLGLLTLNALTAADTVLVPIQCEYYALEGLGQLLSTISLVQKYLNKSIEVEGVLLTMFDARTNLSMQVVEEVKKHFKSKVYKTIIPRNVRLSEAPSHGKPIISYDSKSKGSEVYMELAKEVLGIE
ncbi:sporulation initiation inhibitor Soj [Tepidanaerobacter syntrophicus]|uniref:Sporulation initiation inhibitor protein Soj n=2 Tax=Tepidanaerobacteraceae TaxID=2770092 RepID=A0A0U9HDZ5_9FIRM|nr:chromosome partitioning protein [Tepidanaerobacter syntrophicus]GLI18858.1 sporulation initiation inhibitor Soj [Tepidanaerobacter syntrophicus]